MILTEEELHLCYQALYFEVDQVTDGLRINVDDYHDEIVLMNKDDIGFHPESDPRDIINAGNRGFVFTLEQCRYLDIRLEEIYKYMEDPCKYIMQVLYTIFATTNIKE